MTPIEIRAQFLIALARQLHDANPDFALADVVQIVSAVAVVAEKLTDIRHDH